MRTLISYYGGKQRLASKLLPLVPPHRVYVEPFAGGAALLFRKERPAVSNEENYREVLNDINRHIITLYRVARDRPLELQRYLELTPYSRADHELARDILKGEETDELKIAWATVVQCRQSFTKAMFRGWLRTASQEENHAATWNNYRVDLPLILDRLKDVYLDCTDATKCIRDWDAPDGGTFFYIDPPYPGTNQGHYSGYSFEDFDRLIDTLKTVKGSFLLSCYPNVSDRVPPEWERIDFKARMSAAKAVNGKRANDKRIESVWRKP